MKYFIQDNKGIDIFLDEIPVSNRLDALEEGENVYWNHLTPYERRNRQITVFEAPSIEDVEEQTSDCDIVWDSLEWEAMEELMDSEIREQVHSELAPCRGDEYLKRYLELDLNFIDVINQEFSDFKWMVNHTGSRVSNRKIFNLRRKNSSLRRTARESDDYFGVDRKVVSRWQIMGEIYSFERKTATF